MGETDATRIETKNAENRLDRKSFLAMVSGVALSMAAENFAQNTTQSDFTRLIQQHIDRESARKVVAPSPLEPDMRVKTIKQTPNEPGEPMDHTVFMRFPEYHQQTLFYENTTGKQASIYLELGNHGMLGYGATPIDTVSDSPIHQIDVDGALLTIFGRRNLNNWPIIKETIKKSMSRETKGELVVVNENIPVADEMSGALSDLLNGWVPVRNLSQKEMSAILALDIDTKSTDLYGVGVVNFDSTKNLFEQFQAAIFHADLAMMSLAVKKAIETIAQTNITRRAFLIASAALTLSSLANLVQLVKGKRDLFGRTFKFYTEEPNPSEETPAGYRGVVEDLLKKGDQLSDEGALTLLRDLLTSYKAKVLHRLVPSNESVFSVWGRGHTKKIGLLDLTPEKIFTYLQQYHNNFRPFLLRQFNADYPREQVWTGTGYDYNAEKDNFRITKTNLYLFPKLYSLFFDIQEEK